MNSTKLLLIAVIFGLSLNCSKSTKQETIYDVTYIAYGWGTLDITYINQHGGQTYKEGITDTLKYSFTATKDFHLYISCCSEGRHGSGESIVQIYVNGEMFEADSVFFVHGHYGRCATVEGYL